MQHMSPAVMIGIIGVVMILFAYYQLNMERLRANNLSYLLLNLSGSLMIFYSLLSDWNTPSVIIEFFWIYISLLGLWRYYKKRSA
jgi:multisubunit Na+/H+ antiporter MnhB subunit